MKMMTQTANPRDSIRLLPGTLLYAQAATRQNIHTKYSPHQGILKEILKLDKRGGLGDGSLPAGSRGGAPVESLGDEVPQKLKRIVVYCNKF